MTVPAEMASPYRVMRELPEHLSEWRLPPGWAWGTEGVAREHRHYQEIVDALGRSLSLVTAPDPEHHDWLNGEARHLAHRGHPSIPTTYHYWTSFSETGRGPGYLRRWISGETVGAFVARQGPYDIPTALNLLRTVGSVLAYLHDSGTAHGALAPESVWMTPTGRIWLLGWEWVVPSAEIPAGLHPDQRWTPSAPEWAPSEWTPTAGSDQWQLAALCFAALTGELPPSSGVPPLRLVRPGIPVSVAEVLDRALLPDPEDRYFSVGTMVRSADRAIGGGGRAVIVVAAEPPSGPVEMSHSTEEARLRWATGDDYEVLASLGTGTFGSVWRVRDLTLEREVALKMLHPNISRDERAVARFRREARLAAQLAHPAIVPIYDWDSRGEVSWYTMELAEGGSVGDLIERSGPRPLGEVAPQVDLVLDGLVAAHTHGIIHRDLKPENILIDRYRRWRITDFGIANVAGEDPAGTTGTPAFAAPEQLLGEAQGPAVDCFAIAGIVVFSLTGSPPFGTGDAQTILARELTAQIDLAPYPAAIGQWLKKGLAPEPERRFADAADMQRAWRRAFDAAQAHDDGLPRWRRWSTTPLTTTPTPR